MSSHVIVRGNPPNYYERPVTLWSDEDQQEVDILEDKRQARIRKAFALATDLELTKEQRYELAQMIPGVDKDDGGSWRVLNLKQLHDLITMMEGHIYLKFMLDRDA